MSTFTDESRLLIDNWDTVEDILEACDRLGEELMAVLLSLESDLGQMDWWNELWHFEQGRGSQVHISHENWKTDRGYAILIGVWHMEPEYVFGSGGPGLYVYVGGGNSELRAELVDGLQDRGDSLPGEVDTRGSSNSAAVQGMNRYIGGDIEKYIAETKEQILSFFSAYAKRLLEINERIQQHL